MKAKKLINELLDGGPRETKVIFITEGHNEGYDENDVGWNNLPVWSTSEFTEELVYAEGDEVETLFRKLLSTSKPIGTAKVSFPETSDYPVILTPEFKDARFLYC